MPMSDERKALFDAYYLEREAGAIANARKLAALQRLALPGADVQALTDAAVSWACAENASQKAQTILVDEMRDLDSEEKEHQQAAVRALNSATALGEALLKERQHKP